MCNPRSGLQENQLSSKITSAREYKYTYSFAVDPGGEWKKISWENSAWAQGHLELPELTRMRVPPGMEDNWSGDKQVRKIELSAEALRRMSLSDISLQLKWMIKNPGDRWDKIIPGDIIQSNQKILLLLLAK